MLPKRGTPRHRESPGVLGCGGHSVGRRGPHPTMGNTDPPPSNGQWDGMGWIPNHCKGWGMERDPHAAGSGDGTPLHGGCLLHQNGRIEGARKMGPGEGAAPPQRAVRDKRGVPQPGRQEGGPVGREAPADRPGTGAGGGPRTPTTATHRALLGHHLVQPPGDAHDLLLPAHGGCGSRGQDGGGWRRLPGTHHSPRYRSPGGRRAGHDGTRSPPGARPPLLGAQPSGRTTTPSVPRARPAPPRGTLGAVVRSRKPLPWRPRSGSGPWPLVLVETGK